MKHQAVIFFSISKTQGYFTIYSDQTTRKINSLIPGCFFYMKNSIENGQFFSFSGFLKFGQLAAPFWDFIFFKHIETKVFLSICLKNLKSQNGATSWPNFRNPEKLKNFTLLMLFFIYKKTARN